ELLEEERARVVVDKGDVVMAAEQAHHLRALVLPQKAGIDEDAGELVADRLVDQHRRDRAVDAAREAADNAALAHLRADALHRLLAEGRHGPVAAATRNAMREVLEERAALRRVHDLRVEHHAIEAPAIVGSGGEGRALAHRDRTESRRQRLDAVAVAHPDLLA